MILNYGGSSGEPAERQGGINRPTPAGKLVLPVDVSSWHEPAAPMRTANVG